MSSHNLNVGKIGEDVASDYLSKHGFEIVERNYYFPPNSVNREFLKESDTHSTCPWKGIASYYDVIIKQDINKDAAWYYPDPKPAAKQIKNFIAFWKGIIIQE